VVYCLRPRENHLGRSDHRLKIYSVETLTGIKFITWTCVIFVKKSRNRSTFVFSCPHFGVVGFCVSASGSSEPPLTFFLLMEGYAK
jgi:hypothetical protein